MTLKEMLGEMQDEFLRIKNVAGQIGSYDEVVGICERAINRAGDWKKEISESDFVITKRGPVSVIFPQQKIDIVIAASLRSQLITHGASKLAPSIETYIPLEEGHLCKLSKDELIALYKWLISTSCPIGLAACEKLIEKLELALIAAELGSAFLTGHAGIKPTPSAAPVKPFDPDDL
jgi:hypothetical protein